MLTASHVVGSVVPAGSWSQMTAPTPWALTVPAVNVMTADVQPGEVAPTAETVTFSDTAVPGSRVMTWPTASSAARGLVLSCDGLMVMDVARGDGGFQGGVPGRRRRRG